jgi:glycosyltransferase involved in cell wall biosynthesis
MKVSIIIVSRNAKDTIGRCLDSVTNQTYPNIEIVVVDSSDDGTEKIIEEYQKRSEFLFRIIHQKPKGVGAARNVGLKMASGDICLYVDADQTIPRNYIEKAIGCFDEAENCVGVWMGSILARPSTMIGKLLWLYNVVFYTQKGPIIKGGKCLNASIFKTHFLRDVVGNFDPNIEVGEDIILWQRIYRIMKESDYYFNIYNDDIQKMKDYYKICDKNWVKEDNSILNRIADELLVEYKMGDEDLFSHFNKMIWYGSSKWLLYRRKSISGNEILLPFYLVLVPLFILLAVFFKMFLALLIPFLALFPYSTIKTFKRGFRSIKSLSISLFFPMLMIFKSIGITVGIIKSLIKSFLLGGK